jgi:hypothetical protein
MNMHGFFLINIENKMKFRLTLCLQEPTVQTCLKIVQATCLAQGLEFKCRNAKSSAGFQAFVDRYYIPFAEEAVRYFFSLGFVPWRLRKLPTGDVAPEIIPMGLFTWRIENTGPKMTSWSTSGLTVEQRAAQRAFEKQRAFFSKERKHPYVKKGDGQNTSAFYRQKKALKRMYGGKQLVDEEDSKLLRYTISFVENCGILEEEVEIYEYMQANNSVTRSSVLYGCVPSPLAHLLADYRHVRQAQMRQAYADSYNTQARIICSYRAAAQRTDNDGSNRVANADDPEGGGNGGWNSQQRIGALSDANLPVDDTSNAYTRDVLTERLIFSKPSEHVPLVYTLPKNTSLEPQQKLDSISNVAQMQACSLYFCPTTLLQSSVMY